MSKTLRKYQTWILVIGGGLLMIAFLAPSFIQELGRNVGRGSALKLGDGTSVSPEDYAKSNKIHAMLSTLAPASVIGALNIESKDSLGWLLQSKIAQRAGFTGPKGDGADAQFIEQIAGEEVVGALRAEYGQNWQLFAQFRSEEVNRARQTLVARLQPALVGAVTKDGVRTDEMLAEFRGIRRMREAYLTMPRSSPQRILAEAKRLFDGAILDYFTISVSDDLTGIVEPSEDRIKAHYEKYREVKQGEGDFGWGFSMPARVAVEWLTLERAVIEAAVKLDPVEVQARLLNAPAQADARFQRQQVEDTLRREITDRALRAAADRVKNEILLATSKLADRPASGLKVIPPTGTGITLADLGQAAAQAASAVVGSPVNPAKIASTQLVTREALTQIPGLGRAVMRQGAAELPAADVLMSAEGLPAADRVALTLQPGLPPSAAFDDRAGNVIFAMVTQVRQPGPPASLDEVRAEVIRDLKRQTALELIQRDLNDIIALARETNMADAHTTLAQRGLRVGDLRTNTRVTRVQAQAQDAGIDSEVFREAVMSRVAKLDPTLPVDRRDPTLTFAVTLPKTFSVAVAQVHTYEPLTQELYRAYAGAARNQLLFTEMQAAMDEPFTTKALAKRFGVKDSEIEGDKPADAEGDKAPAAPPASTGSTGTAGNTN